MSSICRVALILATIIGLAGCTDSSSTGVSTASEPAGANCANGGTRIDIGPDDDGDGAPDTIKSTTYACNGVDGMDGTDGVNGVDGMNGTDGMNGMNGIDGIDGTSSLTTSTPELAGENCADGGVRIDSGPDTNTSGAFDPGEIASTEYVCDGAGALSFLTALTAEAAGPNCAAAGVRIDTGGDTNGSGALDPSEVTATSYVCNGSNGMDGMDGDPVAAFGNTPMVNVFSDAELLTAASTNVTVQTATITVPRAGQIMVIGTAEVYCSSTVAPVCGAAPHDLFMTVTNSATADVISGDFSYIHLSPDFSENATRTDVFTVAAGTHTFYIRALGDDAGVTGFYRRALTLVFVPTA